MFEFIETVGAWTLSIQKDNIGICIKISTFFFLLSFHMLNLLGNCSKLTSNRNKKVFHTSNLTLSGTN